MSSNRPLLIYDGECRFCCKWVERLRAFLGQRIDYQPFQDCGSRFPQIAPELFDRSVHLVQMDGSFCSAAEAVFTATALRPEGKPLLWLYRYLPFFAPISETVYKWVASQRVGLSAVDRALTGLTGVTPSYSISSWLFLRGVALVLLIAFLSLVVQVKGLIGDHGIAPAQSFLSQVFQHLGLASFHQVPTIFWLGDSDWMLQGVCLLGVVVSLCALFGRGGAVAFLLCWFLYLSLVVVGGPFLSFQWDSLLLETCFLAALWAPWAFGKIRIGEWKPSFLGRLLLLFLLFRLMFASGLVKLGSGDPTWFNLTALTYHFETQPLPTLLSYYAHQLPEVILRLSVLIMFVIELVLVFFIFGPRRLQLTAAACLLSFQALIALTGNYCFFNLLTALLCLLLIDDESWKRLSRGKIKIPLLSDNSFRLPSWSLVPMAALVLLAALMTFSGQVKPTLSWPDWTHQCYRIIAPFRSINSYGLFAIMTTTRPEIVMEGSRDGKVWLEYRFKWKPRDVNKAPRFIAPHQPRLDWQMWFAALGNYRQNPWLLSFAEKLLQGSPEVLALLAENPFPDQPPRYIRALVYDYQFTTMEEKSKNGQWWNSNYQGIYLPPISLRDAP